jgi:hypothetical protein
LQLRYHAYKKLKHGLIANLFISVMELVVMVESRCGVFL